MSPSTAPSSSPEPTHLDFTTKKLHRENLAKSSLALLHIPHHPPDRMTSSHLPRLRAELQHQVEIEEAWDPFATWAPIANDIRDLLAVLRGPQDTPYENGVFFLRIYIPETYPMSPPIVKFLTKVYHPNIDAEGRVCVNILDSAWSPVLNITALLTSLLSLLSEPVIEEPLVPEIAVQYLEDVKKYEEIVRDHTQRYATEAVGVMNETVDEREWWYDVKVETGASSTKTAETARQL